MPYFEQEIPAVFAISLLTNYMAEAIRKGKVLFCLVSSESYNSPRREDLILMVTRKCGRRFSYSCGPGNHDTTFKGNPLVVTKPHILKMAQPSKKHHSAWIKSSKQDLLEHSRLKS